VALYAFEMKTYKLSASDDQNWTRQVNTVYPEISPFEARQIAADDVHTLHVEQYGNPDGVPVVFLHGGPGASWSRHDLRVFDPAHYRIICFDQRGTWRSTPLGELKDNTTPHLIADIETLRDMFGVQQWIVYGGSWGSALAVAYAEAYPDHCSALVVRGVTLFRPGFEHWDFRMTRRLYPEAWHELAALAPTNQHDNLYEFYRRAILSEERDVALEASQYWYAFSDLLSNSCNIDPAFSEPDEPNELVLAGARISMHYWEHAAFLPPDALYDNTHQLRDLPGAIVHGRNDYNCPVSDAFDLHQAWPRATFKIVENAGHSCQEPETMQFLLNTMERLKTEAR